MTGWEVERTPRAAYPVSWLPGTVSSPMPPHSQGAERRTERRAGRTGSRWALRALVIGGLAGAAWMLTGAAAQAAERDPAPEGLLGSSLVRTVVDSGTVSPVVGTVLKAAAQPLETDRSDRHHRTFASGSSVLDAPVRILTGSAGEVTETLDESPTTVVDDVVRDVTGPLRLTGGPADPPEPITQNSGPTSTDADVDDSGEDDRSPAQDAPAPVDAVEVMPEEPARTPIKGESAIKRVADTTAGLSPHRSAGTQHTTVTERTAVTAAAPDMVQDSTPAGDGPAPLQMHLGALSGISTSGSGAPTEGGSAAYLPAAVGGGSVTHHRSAFPADVEVRRHDAEAPTVSPD